MATTERPETSQTPETPTQQPPARAPQQDQQPQRAARSRYNPLALQASRAFGPFSLMRRLFEDLGRLSGLGLPPEREQEPEQAPRAAVALFVPEVEIAHRGDRLVAQIDLPGLGADDVRVTIDDGLLIVEGERRSEYERNEGDVWTCERSYGRFQRVIPLPENADIESAEARFENGVLEISIRAPEQKTQGKTIPIQGASQSEAQRQPTAQ